MELLEPKDKKAAANKNGTLPATNSAQKSLPVSGIQSGSSLGIVAPEYPESSRIKGEEGEVIIAFTLDENEKLVSSQIEQSSGFEAIDKSAQKAVDTHYEESTNKVRDKTFRVRFKFQLAK